MEVTFYKIQGYTDAGTGIFATVTSENCHAVNNGDTIYYHIQSTIPRYNNNISLNISNATRMASALSAHNNNRITNNNNNNFNNNNNNVTNAFSIDNINITDLSNGQVTNISNSNHNLESNTNTNKGTFNYYVEMKWGHRVFCEM